MRITYLLEVADRIWGGVKSVLEDANALSDRGHTVTIVAKSPPPEWFELRCAFRTVSAFSPDAIPAADVVVAAGCTTVPFAIDAGRGVPVHYVQGYEGANPDWSDWRDRIESLYRLREAHKITIAPHLERLLLDRGFCDEVWNVGYGVDHAVMYPTSTYRRPARPFRIGLVGPYDVSFKGIRTGIEACRLAAAAGLEFELVRVTNTAPHADERDLPFPVEWHERVPPTEMGDLYRSMDVLLGTSTGEAEGFFLPAVEAMACGVPCVLTDILCHRSYGDSQYALFVEPESPADLAEAAIVVCNHPTVHESLREQGLRVAEEYTHEGHVDAFERAIEELVARFAPRPAPTDTAATADDTVTPTREGPLTKLTERLTESLLEAGELYLNRDDAETACAHLRAARELAPAEPLVTQRLAYALFAAGRRDESLACYDELLDVPGADTAAVHESRGLVLFQLGRCSESHRAFAQALATGTPTAELWNNYGVTCHQLRRTDDARDAFERALQLEPDHVDASANLTAVAPPGAQTARSHDSW